MRCCSGSRVRATSSARCRATPLMRRVLRTVGRIEVPGAKVTLRMSQGVHSGRIPFLCGRHVARRIAADGPRLEPPRCHGARGGGGRDSAQHRNRRAAPRPLSRGREGSRGAAQARAGGPRRQGAAAAASGDTLRDACAVPVAGDSRTRARRRRIIRAPARHDRLHPVQGHRRLDRTQRSGRGGRRAASPGERGRGGHRGARGRVPRLRRRRRRRQADPDVRRTQGHRRRRGADAARAAQDRRHRAADFHPDRRQPRFRLRRRHRAGLPPHVYGDGRCGEPVRAADGQGLPGNDLRDGGRARPLEHAVRDDRARAVLRQGQGAAGSGVGARPRQRFADPAGIDAAAAVDRSRGRARGDARRRSAR